jgi:hypothetical protein
MSCELAVLLVPPYVPPDPEVVELDEVSLSGVVLVVGSSSSSAVVVVVVVVVDSVSVEGDMSRELGEVVPGVVVLGEVVVEDGLDSG